MVFDGAQFYSGSLSKKNPSQIPALPSTLDSVRMTTSQLKVYSKIEMGDRERVRKCYQELKFSKEKIDWILAILEVLQYWSLVDALKNVSKNKLS